MKQMLRLWYDEPAPNRGRESSERTAKDPDWEQWSLPLGCGYMGLNIFGRTDTERIQVTENSLANPSRAGLNNFAEIELEMRHDPKQVKQYERDLVLDDATAHVRYEWNGVTYRREYFCSYPDKVAVIRMEASEKGALSFSVEAKTPYLRPFGEEDHQGKTGKVRVEDNCITLSGKMEYYQIEYEGQILVQTEGGTLRKAERKLIVEHADSAFLLVAVGTNYELSKKVYLEKDRTKKLEGTTHPHEKVSRILMDASQKSYAELRRRHVEDYQALFHRVQASFGTVSEEETSTPTDKLLQQYKEGKYSHYLEQVYFQYGRYLLISSSRKGTLPGNLQGIWNQYDASPWSAGYWHNINIQMNYWHAFSTDLAELFESYVDMNEAFREKAKQNADVYLEEIQNGERKGFYDVPMEPMGSGKNGWAVGTGGWPYDISAPSPNSHSGPGTGGLTTQVFWDYYDFTRDEEILKNHVYPVLESMDQFLNKTVVREGEELLAYPSASPEQCINGIYPNYYHTIGCAFDQQMIYENHKNYLAAAKVLGVENETTAIARHQMPKLSPVLIGTSGQVKEYREEQEYGEIGQKNHRHLSQLVALCPGQTINRETREWLEAAKVSLTMRGDESTGWAMAHRLNSWARVGDGEHAYLVLNHLLSKGTLPNLWDTHPPFQIDGNYGGTAGIAEMLLQSCNGWIYPLPALPDAWKDGSFQGLVARGNYSVSVWWKEKKIQTLELTARVGGTVKICYPGIQEMRCERVDDQTVMEKKCETMDKDRMVCEMEKGEKIRICLFPNRNSDERVVNEEDR